MTRLIRPPRGFFIPTTVIFDPAFKPNIRETLIQFMALTWKSPKKHKTQPFTIEEISALIGKSPSTIFRHLAVLRDTHSALRLHSDGKGNYSVVLSSWLYGKPRSHSSVPVKPGHSPPPGAAHRPDSQLSELTLKEEESIFMDVIKQLKILLLNNKDHLNHPDPGRSPASHAVDSGGPRSPSMLPPQPNTAADDREDPPITRYFPKKSMRRFPSRLTGELRSALLEAGVFPVLLREVAESGRSAEDLTNLLNWTRVDQPDLPAPLFLARLRAGASVPPIYRQPPCPHCGRYGEHAEDCRDRYVSGDLVDFIES